MKNKVVGLLLFSFMGVYSMTQVPASASFDSIGADKALVYDAVQQVTGCIEQNTKNNTKSFECKLPLDMVLLLQSTTSDETVKVRDELWLGVERQLINNGSYSWFNVSKYGYGLSQQGIFVFSAEYRETLEQTKFVREHVNRVFNNLKINKNKPTLKDIEKIQNYIAWRVAYTDKTKGSAYSAYTAIMERKGVCQAYSAYFTMAMQELGFQSRMVLGYDKNDKSEYHMWSAVKINGIWKYFDVTWNDVGSKSVNKYYNLTLDELRKTHAW